MDLLLLGAIYAQWWLVGWRLDRLQSQRKSTTRIKVPALVITIAGVLAALLSRGPGILEMVAVLACLIALLGWVVLILVAVITLFRMAFQFRGRSASV